MLKVYPFLFFLSVVVLTLPPMYVYFRRVAKNENPNLIILGIILFMGPVLLATAVLLNSSELFFSATFFPISLYMIATSIEHFVRYKKCTIIVSAKCVSFNTSGNGQYYAPQFSYNYNGESILRYSFLFYPKRKFNKLFVINNTYNIFINPRNPKDCVDKRYFPIDTIFILIFGIILFTFFIFGVKFI